MLRLKKHNKQKCKKLHFGKEPFLLMGELIQVSLVTGSEAACCDAGIGGEKRVSDQPARILFVEDDAHVRLLIEDALQDAGYAVESAGTVASGQLLLDAG